MQYPVMEFGLFRLEHDIVYNLNHERIDLPDQSVQVLKVFLTHALQHGKASLSSEELQQKAWAGRTVERNNVHQQIALLRRALGTDAIQRTSGPRGYAFTFPVHLTGRSAQVRWHSLSVVPFVCPPGFFREEERLRLAGYHLALGLIEQLQHCTDLEIREITPEYLMPGWQPNTKQIAKAQQTELVLSGTLTASAGGDEVRAQLIEAETLTILWSVRFQVNIADSSAFERDAARQIAARLGFDSPSATSVNRRQPKPEAVASYRKGRYLYLTQHAILKEAFDEFSYAVSLDPDYAEPWAGLADVWILRCTYGPTDYAPNDGMPKALAAANRALEINPQSSDAHIARGVIATFWEWNWDLAESHLKLALQYTPDHFVAAMQMARLLSFRRRFDESLQYAEQSLKGCRHFALGVALAAWMYYFAGQYEKALSLCHEALEKIPQQPNALAVLGFVQEATGKYEEAATTCQQAIASGETLLSLATLGVVYGRLGQRAEAEQVLEQLAERKQKQYISPYHSAVIYAALDRHEEALHWLELAFADRSEWIPHSVVDYRLRDLHHHSRYQSLIRQIGLSVP
jgi:tetratricopeptide (TPR) repeat protein